MASRILTTSRKIIVRLYACIIMLVVIWAGYTAVAYLFRAVFRPVPVPRQFLAWQGHVEARGLRMENVPGITGPAARAPLAHYHTVDRWFQPEPHNGCITAGCHEPLPHNKRKETRAFANLHSTFQECMMCHATPAAPQPAMWISIATGQPQGVPPILQLIRVLEVESDTVKASPAAVSGTIVDLLGQSIAAAGGDSLLEYLLIELHACQPGSPVWRHTIRRLTEALPNRARGEYGAKIAPRATDTDLRREARELTEQMKQHQTAAPGSAARDEAYRKIHASVVAKPRGCVSCHGGTPARLDFEALGYSPARVSALRSSPTAKLMQDIQEGRPFYLPRLGEGGDVH